MTRPDTDILIDFQDISLVRNKDPLFSRFNFAAAAKDKYLIQGRSGSGKTTLFKLMLGFDTPDTGQVLFDGMPVSKENILKIRKQIFYLSQDIDLRNDTVINVLKEILFENGRPLPDKTLLEPYITLLELKKGIFDQEIAELSGGERQRTGLLICFLLNRPVWILDEPTAALDDLLKQKVTDYILNSDKTILVVSHDEVWKNDDRIKIKRLN